MNVSNICMGYVTIAFLFAFLLALDATYYSWIRPKFVKQRKFEEKQITNPTFIWRQNISSFWCDVEHYSRNLTPFWNVLDSVECFFILSLFFSLFVFSMLFNFFFIVFLCLSFKKE